MKTINRLVSLDAIRGVSIFAIVAYHVVQRWPLEVHWLVRFISDYGQYGVDLFFALSGLLVGVSTAKSIAARNNHGDLKRLLSRFVRIYIPYFVALMIAYAGVRVFRGEEFNPMFLVLFQNYLLKIPFFLVSWFLCIVFAFYVLAYCLPRIKGMSVRSSSYMLLLIAISCVLQRSLLVVLGSVEPNSPFGFFFTATHLRADSIALAFAVGLVIDRNKIMHQLKNISGLAACAGITLLAIPLVLTRYLPFEGIYIFAPFFAAVPSALLVSWAYLRKEAWGGMAKMLAKVSAVAFSLYLTHPFAIEATIRINNAASLSQPILFFVLICLMAVLATLFFVGVERPSMRVAGLIKDSQ